MHTNSAVIQQTQLRRATAQSHHAPDRAASRRALPLHSAGSILCILSVLGCGSEAEPAPHGSSALVGLDAVATPARAEPVDVEPQVSEDWVGYGLGISPGRWRYLGELKMAGPGDRYVEPTYDPTAPSRPDRNPGAVVLFDDASKRVYEVNVPQEDLDRLAAEVAPLGFVEQDLPADAVLGEEDTEVTKSWSYGSDARIPRNIADYGADHFPYRTIGALKWDGLGGSRDGHCTASFVHNPYGSRRYILTAAHCIWATESGNYIDPDFYPRNVRVHALPCGQHAPRSAPPAALRLRFRYSRTGVRSVPVLGAPGWAPPPAARSGLRGGPSGAVNAYHETIDA
jgi:hypothetical protein